MSKISIKNLDLYYGDFKALKDVNLEIEANKITAFIGPSGCGKSRAAALKGRSFWTDRTFLKVWM